MQYTTEILNGVVAANRLVVNSSLIGATKDDCFMHVGDNTFELFAAALATLDNAPNPSLTGTITLNAAINVGATYKILIIARKQ